MRQLKNINTIDDVLPVEAFGNFSNDDVNSTDVEPPHWRAVQARAVLGDLIMKAENWGPVSEMSENWELKNIKYDSVFKQEPVRPLVQTRVICPIVKLP